MPPHSRAITTQACAVGLDVSVTQIKEKFGMVRVYVEGGDDEIEHPIDAAEAESAMICEVCGPRGTASQRDGVRPGACQVGMETS